jgi:hypothetical protein
LARPPTKKNSGITWSSQVASHSPGTRAIALPPSIRPSRQPTTAISQCPATTTTMLATRSRSANRSRSAGVAAATRLAALVSASMAGPRRLDGPDRVQPGLAGHRPASGFWLNSGAGPTQVQVGTSGSRARTVRVYGGFVEG